MEGDELLLDDGTKVKLMDKVGTGSFGVVRRGKESKGGEEIAVKLEAVTRSSHFLTKEYRIFKDLQGKPGIPKLIGKGANQDYIYLCIELLGNNLSHKFKKCNKRFSLETVLQLADQLFEILDGVHSLNYIHRDIKPNNFLMGLGTAATRVYVIDFGLSRKMKLDYRFNTPGRDCSGIIGTMPFISVNTHLGGECSKRDDLESLFYMLVYFFQGRLPWQSHGKKVEANEVRRMKQTIATHVLCEGMPEEFEHFFTYIRGLKYESNPNYSEIRARFQDIGARIGLNYTWVYDWNKPFPRSHSPKGSLDTDLKSSIGVEKANSQDDHQDGHSQKGKEFRSIGGNRTKGKNALHASHSRNHMTASARKFSRSIARQQTTVQPFSPNFHRPSYIKRDETKETFTGVSFECTEPSPSEEETPRTCVFF